MGCRLHICTDRTLNTVKIINLVKTFYVSTVGNGANMCKSLVVKKMGNMCMSTVCMSDDTHCEFSISKGNKYKTQ